MAVQNLPIQVAGLDVAHALWLRRTEQDQIGGEGLAALDTDNVSDLDRVPGLGHECVSLQHLGCSCIRFAVGSVSFLIYQNVYLTVSSWCKDKKDMFR